MKLITIAVMAFGLSAGLAGAQTTQCYPNNPMVPAAGEHCETTPSAQQMLQQNEVSTVGVGPHKPIWERMADSKRRKEVGGLIADGKCAEARKVALREGDFELAEHVQQLCATPEPAPK